MSSRIRFSRAADVFAAFPTLRRFVAPPIDDVEPLEHARRLIGLSNPMGAVAFMAHLLPRREAVWWGRQCLSATLGEAAEDAAFRAAEIWVRAPDEDNRRAAMEIGETAERESPSTHLALAAARSGGSLSSADQTAFPAPAEACAQSVQAAVVLAICSRPGPLIRPWVVSCVEAGIQFAGGGDSKVLAPPKGS